MRELDLPLQRYLDEDYDLAGQREQAAFVRLLDESDDALWHYLYGDLSPDDTGLADLVRKIRRTAASPP